MSAAKPRIERLLKRAKRARRRAALRRPLPIGPATRFVRHPERISGATEWPADDPITPAARLLMEGEPFEIGGDLYSVEAVHRSTIGRQADVLILRGHELARGEEHSTRRAIQVRDLETLIDDDRVGITFIGCARQYNLSRGWCRGGCTLASLGIDLGDANRLTI